MFQVVMNTINSYTILVAKVQIVVRKLKTPDRSTRARRLSKRCGSPVVESEDTRRHRIHEWLNPLVYTDLNLQLFVRSDLTRRNLWSTNFLSMWRESPSRTFNLLVVFVERGYILLTDFTGIYLHFLEQPYYHIPQKITQLFYIFITAVLYYVY